MRPAHPRLGTKPRGFWGKNTLAIVIARTAQQNSANPWRGPLDRLVFVAGSAVEILEGLQCSFDAVGFHHAPARLAHLLQLFRRKLQDAGDLGGEVVTVIRSEQVAVFTVPDQMRERHASASSTGVEADMASSVTRD
ncbi:hypothetical protein AHiyo6_28220 [Arthrobacter sp. Hiyo6]|nr:hypothetical protein AHiyo6_28220 [Arthrobacter sp. Hiyo6]